MEINGAKAVVTGAAGDLVVRLPVPCTPVALG
ncbi:MAG: hypothetical protein QOH27_5286 [Mycobacterium sp.]|jgi:hypothetical protein|nr:hypothetical protein [Mycobacterium sp.]